MEFEWTNGRVLSQITVNPTDPNGTEDVYSYTYDESGIRSSKTVNGVTHTYVYASGKLLQETYGSNTLDFFYSTSGQPYALSYNGTTYYYITNLQGDVMQIINANGEVVAEYEYDPYGNIISATGELAEVNPLRYRGYIYDSECNLYYLQSRYYDPGTGKFLNRDVVYDLDTGLQGYNLFVYCGNNPVRRVDISGADSVDMIDGDEDADEPLIKDGGCGRGHRPSPPTGNPSGNGSGFAGHHNVESGNSDQSATNNPATGNYNPLKGITYTEKVQVQKAQGDYHSFPDIVDNYGTYGQQQTIAGGDGNTYTRISIVGMYGGKSGAFVYIINANGVCNHRMFEVNYTK